MSRKLQYMQSPIVIGALSNLGVTCYRLALHVTSILIKMDKLRISECVVHFSEIDFAKTALEIFVNDIGAKVTFSQTINGKCGASVYFGKQTVGALNISYFIAHQISIYETMISTTPGYIPIHEGSIFSYVKQNISNHTALSLYGLDKQKKRLLEMIADIEKLTSTLGKLAIRGIVVNNVIHCGIHIPSTVVPKENRPKDKKKYEKLENTLVRYIRYLEGSGHRISIAGDGNGAFPSIGEKLDYKFEGCRFITGFGAPAQLFTRDGNVVGVDGMVNDPQLKTTPLEPLDNVAVNITNTFKRAFDDANGDVTNAQLSMSFRKFMDTYASDHVIIWNRVNDMPVIIASFLSESRLEATSKHWGL